MGKEEISMVCTAELNLGGGGKFFDIRRRRERGSFTDVCYKCRTGNTDVWTSHRPQMGSALSPLVHPEGRGLPCPDRAWLKAGL